MILSDTGSIGAKFSIILGLLVAPVHKPKLLLGTKTIMPIFPKRFAKHKFLAVLLILSSHVCVASSPEPPKIGVRSFILQDYHSGRVLAEENADSPVEPASITKMMSAFVVFGEIKSGRLNLQDEVKVSRKAWKTKGSKMFIEVNSQVKVEELIKGMIIQSGNDATVALAEHIGGSEEVFVAMMNDQARKLGMKNSRFQNSTGLPAPEHRTTAKDISLLAVAMIKRFPEFYQLHKEKKYTYNGITQYNRNKLLWRDKTVDGIKTGHTNAAGYCLVASAKRDNMRLISVVLGAKSENGRAKASQNLLDFGFEHYETHQLYASQESMSTVQVWKGATAKVQVGPTEDIYVTIPKGEYEKLNASLIIKTLIAPIIKGEEYGTVNITLDSVEIARVPVVALSGVQTGNLWQRFVDQVNLWFE